MVFFKTKHFQADEVERHIRIGLEKRSALPDHHADFFKHCSSDLFLEKHNSRPFTRLKLLANHLPAWVYAVCKLFPFYQTIRQRLKLPVEKK